MKKSFLWFVTALLISLSGMISAQSGTDIAELFLQVEKNPQIEATAKELALRQHLPISIHLPDGTFMEALAYQDQEPLYAVVRNMAHPTLNGEVLTFTEIRSRFELATARLNYGHSAVQARTAKSHRGHLSNANGLLLIPESTGDRVMGFDPTSGDLVDLDFIPPSTGILDTPIHALQTPWGTITISDQLEDLVQEFDTSGTFIQSLAPAGGVNTAILDNMRGHGYRPNGDLIVTVASGANTNAIAEFDQGGNYLGNFIANGAGGLNSPWSIFYRSGDILVTGGSTPSGVFSYDFNGAFLSVFAPVNTFAEQAVELPDGNVAVAVFSIPGTGVSIYDSNGTFLRSLTGVTGNRGVWYLGSGSLITTNGGGVHEIDYNTGALIRTIVAGSSARFVSFYQPSSGGTAGFSVNPSFVDFGSVASGTSATDSVEVMNTGTAQLNISSVVSDNPSFTVDPTSGSLAQGDNMMFGITFTAGSTPGPETANIVFTHNGPTSPDTVVAQADILVGIGNGDELAPISYALHQNYPNPFNPATAIRYSIPVAERVTLTVYDLRGQEVAVLVNSHQNAGVHEVQFDARDLASGVYFYQIKAGSFTSTRKMLLMK